MSTFHRGYKFKIYPNEEQKKQLDCFIDLFRYVYNWGLSKEEELYELYKEGLSSKRFYNFYDLCDLFTQERNDPNKEWLKEIPNTTARLALRNVINAYNKFFKKINKRPKLKTKKKDNGSFNTRNDRFRIYDDQIKIEGIDTRIDLGFNPGLNYTDCKYINPTVTRNYFGEYFVSFSLEEESKPLEISKTEGVGIDLGIRQTFVLSTGEIFNQPMEKLERLERQRRRQIERVSRDINRRLEIADRTKTKYDDIPMSKLAEKKLNRLRKIEQKIHNIKEDCYHKIVKKIVDRNPEFVCVETFRVKDIGHDNPYMFKHLVKVSFYDITQKVKEKCEEREILFIEAPQQFPSSQICSNCGNVKKIHGKHTYKCKVCGFEEDRDINAAINLRDYGLELLYSNIGKIE